VSAVDLVLDGALVAALVLLAIRVLTSELRVAIILFIAFGLIAAIAWVRLAVPDVALVEAILSAGITGVLLLGAAGSIGSAHEEEPRSRRSALLVVTAWLALVAGMSWAVLALPEAGAGLTPAVEGALDRTGVSHPVTAVLLNLRAHDTLLEVMVLLAAALGVQAMFSDRVPPVEAPPATTPMYCAMARLLFPAMVLAAGFLLEQGSHAPGGAFQAGAILAGGGLLLVLGGRIGPIHHSSAIVRVAALVGPAGFLVVAGLPVLAGDRLLEIPMAWAHWILLAIESLLAISIAFLLLLTFPGMPRSDGGE
jgi:multisubunit Na+/H+ antiporter MnhB subunit